MRQHRFHQFRRDRLLARLVARFERQRQVQLNRPSPCSDKLSYPVPAVAGVCGIRCSAKVACGPLKNPQEHGEYMSTLSTRVHGVHADLYKSLKLLEIVAIICAI